ncbi:uncharacterized protein [Littorina saxatilis]|uniref:uncharacterized protein n=1 Tax=Littorina saxatilis TaxID=31220 RepID=UPI0038B4654D
MAQCIYVFHPPPSVSGNLAIMFDQYQLAENNRMFGRVIMGKTSGREITDTMVLDTGNHPTAMTRNLLVKTASVAILNFTSIANTREKFIFNVSFTAAKKTDWCESPGSMDITHEQSETSFMLASPPLSEWSSNVQYKANTFCKWTIDFANTNERRTMWVTFHWKNMSMEDGQIGCKNDYVQIGTANETKRFCRMPLAPTSFSEYIAQNQT